MKSISRHAIIIMSAGIAVSAFSAPEIRAGIGYVTTIEVTDSSGGSLFFVDEGTFYDELSPAISLLWNFRGVSIGPTLRYSYASELFADFQKTTLRGFSAGAEFIYNYEMDDSGDCLFPMLISGERRWTRLEFETEHKTYEIEGFGWEMRAMLGLERVFWRRYSAGILIGQGLAWEDLSNETVRPKLKTNGWRFEIFFRARP